MPNRKEMDPANTYREAGWRVDYDKPAHNETYPAIFTFKIPKKASS